MKKAENLSNWELPYPARTSIVPDPERPDLIRPDLGQAIMARARNFPGQEREFFDFVRQNREALEQIRAPLFEDKVVDMILEKADVTDVPVTKEDLEKEIEALDAEDAA